MLALERQREIVNVVAAQGRARVSELAERFDVTEETIRRDLEKLEADGKLVRSHGGAVPALEKEAPHWQREFVNQTEKEAIARAAARMVNPGERVLLDASSTAWFLAQRLADLELTVITNSLHCALALGEAGKAKVISPGGTLAATSLSFVGSETQQALRRYHGEKLFMSCRGLDLQRGASDISEEQAMVRRVLMEIADQRVLMVDSSKLGVRALSIIASADAFTHIITDDKADPEFCRQLEQMGVIVQRAGL